MLALWPAAGGEMRLVPARCYSWRHEGPCRAFRAASDAERIAGALEGAEPREVVFLVLTLDPSAWTADGWTGPALERRADALADADARGAAYQLLSDRWTVLARRLRRAGHVLRYVSTVESHRSGWPHLNVLLHCPTLAEEIAAAAGPPVEGGEARRARGRRAASFVLGEALVSAGFGHVGFAEVAADLRAIADYMGATAGKVADSARKLDPAAALVDDVHRQRLAREAAKWAQTPVLTPPHFRRLRSSRGFLPARPKGDHTGALVRGEGAPTPEEQLAELARRGATVAERSKVLRTLPLDDFDRRRQGAIMGAATSEPPALRRPPAAEVLLAERRQLEEIPESWEELVELWTTRHARPPPTGDPRALRDLLLEPRTTWTASTRERALEVALAEISGVDAPPRRFVMRR